MKTIDVDIEVYDALRARIEDFGESPNSVLRRVLGLNVSPSGREPTRALSSPNGRPAPADTSRPKRLPGQPGVGITMKQLAPFIIEALGRAGGELSKEELFAAVEREAGHLFAESDWRGVGKDKRPRWQLQMYNIRKELRDAKLFDTLAAKGQWKLTAKGMGKYARAPRTDSGQLAAPSLFAAKTSERDLKYPLIETMYELGGQAPCKDILERVEAKVAHILTEVDREKGPTGEPTWRHTLRSAHQHMKGEGLTEASGEYGMWKLTDRAISEFEARMA